jgi:trigger factor
VDRAAKSGDEVIIDFKGVDTKTKEAISGADGTGYPLQLGSNTFIPGFEDEVVGVKPGGEKTFDLTFPKDYGVKALQGRKVSFTVTVQKVQELQKPKLDEAFAATLGPFKTVAELKTDVKRQLQSEKEQEAQRAYDNELLEKIAAKSSVDVPEVMVEEEVDRIEEEEKRNVTYRGQTWQEHLDEEGLTAEAHREKNKPSAELRVKGGLILSEIAEKEQISVTPEELEMRMQLLKGQYPDPNMQAELDKPENRRDILSRMLTEKTLDALRSYASK